MSPVVVKFFIFKFSNLQNCSTKSGRGGPCEEEIQIYTNKVDSPWGEAIRGPKGGS
jgi:hypothetical protein